MSMLVNNNAVEKKENEMNTVEVKIENVMKVYSGKARTCCCGCAGKYTTAVKHLALAGEMRGYAYDAEEANDRSVKLIVGKINKAIASGVQPDVDAEYVSVTVGERIWTAYLLPSAADIAKLRAARAARKAAAAPVQQELGL